MRGSLFRIVQILALLLYIEVSLSLTTKNQDGCFNSDVILTCPNYKESKSGKLSWWIFDKTAKKWSEIANIRNGNRTVHPSNSTLDERLTIHRNGSLEIASLEPNDETRYQCKSYLGSLKVHVIYLKVACGKVTLVKREVCVEEDVVLECDAKHRTNPQKIKQVKWHKKLKSAANTWLLLATSSGSTAVVGNGFKLDRNGSLLLQGGRDESEIIYKCDVTKKASRKLDRHTIVVKNVKCQRERRSTATVKTTNGRAAMTTPTVVVMETSIPTRETKWPLISGSDSSVFPLSQIFVCLLLQLVVWLIEGMVLC